MFNYEDGTSKGLQDSLSFVTKLLQNSYQEIRKTPVKKIQHSCQEIRNTPVKKMIEYLIFFLLCTLLYYLYVRTKRYITLLKMVEESIDNLISSGYDDDSRRQRLLGCILTGNSKLCLGKIYTDEQIKKLSAEEVDKRFSNYEAKLLGQMV